MGRPLSGPEYFETRMSEYLVEYFSDLGVEHQRIEVVPGRSNVVARLPGANGGPTVLLDAHQDTVPVDGMTIPPFEPSVENGRLYGRGACDVKGGMASMLAAFARLAADGGAHAATVVMSCTCDEESTQLGIRDLVQLWQEPQPRVDWLTSAPDMAIIAEPTELHVVVAHRGASRWKILTPGRACHSSDPTQGVNAIYRMAKVLECLERYASELGDRVKPHPLCGPATLSVGRIEGGVSVNVVPDACTIEVDRRCIPGEDGNAAIEAVGEYLREHLDFDFEMLPPWIIGETLSDDDNGPLADRLMSAIEEFAGDRRKIGVPYGTHASRTCEAGVPSVVFGPGSIAQAHTKDEWIEVDQLQKAADIYYRFCTSFD
ncbi:MAG: M20 family peptidase [Planctomycetota bacterium]|nr:MAG: M20 family peptidase [Planctomycetota bacterium]